MKRRWLCVAALFLLIGILPGCIQMENMKKEQDLETTASEEIPDPGTIISEDRDWYTKRNETYLVLVNKTHPVSDAYNPETDAYCLEPLKTLTAWIKQDGREQKLEGRTLRALDAMLRTMQADGIAGVYVTSSHRTLAYQERLFDTYYKSEKGSSVQTKEVIDCLGTEYIRSQYLAQGKAFLTDEDAEKVANYYSAKAGQSEHHTGLCVDLMTDGMKELDETFSNTAAFAWLSENAYRFGFILRYPKGKESITGYCYEPWHYRFVGAEVASEIWARGITLEEYLEVN